jgi:tetratricopeptide (TPR) repeat protein
MIAPMSTPRTIKVFIASPSDLAVERREFKEVIDELNKGYGRGAHVTFEPLGWEDALATVARRAQSVINQDIDACDVFVLVMWRRWGQDAPDAAPYSSYTEEEFYRALGRFEKEKRPTIFVLFKHIDPGQMADAGPQLAKVLAFRRKLEETRRVLYRGFDDEKSFRAEIDKHLTGFVEGKCETVDGPSAAPLIPDSIRTELEKHRGAAEQALIELERMRGEAERAQREAEQARAEAKDANARADAAARLAESTAAAQSLKLAEDAAKAALEGRIEEARQGFAKALEGTTNTAVLFLGFEFFRRIGELTEAERLLRRWLAISGPDAETPSTANAYGNLGLILNVRGELDQAEAMLRKSLAIYEKLGDVRRMADEYGNLGLVLQTRDLDAAEVMHRKSLEIYERLGELEGIANGYANVGLILQIRGDLAEAEAMVRKALEIHKKLGQIEAMASGYGNLGIILQERRDFGGAEAMHRKALEINKKLRRMEGMASQYGNLGLILRTRRDLEGAESMHRKALEINEKLGRLVGMAIQYGNLGLILRERGDLEGAETKFRESIAIDEKLGRSEGLAISYGNMGSVKNALGDLTAAREYWSKSRDLYAKLRAPQEVDRMQKLIDGLPK